MKGWVSFVEYYLKVGYRWVLLEGQISLGIVGRLDIVGCSWKVGNRWVLLQSWVSLEAWVSLGIVAKLVLLGGWISFGSAHVV